MTNLELQELLKQYPDNLEIWIDAWNQEGGIKTNNVKLKAEKSYPVIVIAGQAGYCQTYYMRSPKND
jgi:hypothetical protein